MQFITSLFGGSGNSILTSVFALGVVLVLIVLALWLLKVVFRASGNIGRGRNRRLAVVDTMAIDPKRQLIIIRRDNVEHLILTGGPQDLLVETGIPVEEAPVAVSSRRPVPSIPTTLPRPQTNITPAPAPVVTAPATPAFVAPMTPVTSPAPSPSPAALAPDEPEAGPMPVAANSVTALNRLRDLGKTNKDRRPTSLRHTGLMRPVSQMEAAPLPNEKSNGGQPDSAKEVVNTSNDPDGQAEFGESSGTENGDGYSADRN